MLVGLGSNFHTPRTGSLVCTEMEIMDETESAHLVVFTFIDCGLQYALAVHEILR